MSNCISGFALLAIAFVDENEHELIVILATIGIIGMYVVVFPSITRKTC
jgi:hypothetical protein